MNARTRRLRRHRSELESTDLVLSIIAAGLTVLAVCFVLINMGTN